VVRGPGRVELYTGCASSGQGHETVMAQILADALAIPFQWISVFHGSTNLVAEGWGTYHSRAVVVGGSAVVTAATALQAQLVTVEDVGRAINPALVHGQALGSAVQGLGGAFLEELVYDETGQLVSGTLADYALPTAADFPSIESITLQDAPSTSNPLGAKGA